MAGLIGGGLSIVAGKLREIASDIVTVRTGTVVSDYAPMSQTLVTLDNDPEQSTVQALALNGPLPSGARVMMWAYPPRGLAIVGTMVDVTIPGDVIEILTTRQFLASEVAGAKVIKVRVIGGGGGGGGASITTNTQSSFGSGGCSGGYAEAILNVASLAFPITATVGAGGASASTGGSTSFGIYVAATGGPGGQTGNVASGAGLSAITSGPPGVGTAGDILRYGNNGTPGFRMGTTATGPGTNVPPGVSGQGGAGPMGDGLVTYTPFNDSNGIAATTAQGSGAGGGGAYNYFSATAKSGGAGASGSIVVEVIR